jgi:hypothetical protein
MISIHRRPELWLSFASIILVLGMGEFAARRFLPGPIRVNRAPPPPGRPDNGRAMRSLHRADPLLGWTLNPGPSTYRHRMAGKDGTVLYDVVYGVTTDGHRRTSAQPPESAPIIIATGCSFTFGHAIRDEDTWPWQLQERLPGYHVMNVAVMAYGTDQALLAAERQLNNSPYRIAAVVLGLGDFQIERNRSPQGWLASVYPFSKPLFAIGPHGVEYKGQVRFWPPPFPRSSLLGDFTNVLADQVYRIGNHDEATQLTAALIRDFARRFQARGVPLAVTLLPHAGDETKGAIADTAYLVKEMRAVGIPTLIPQLPRLPGGGVDIAKIMVTSADKHPNREYNSRLVDQLYPFLESSGIVSPQGDKSFDSAGKRSNAAGQ